MDKKLAQYRARKRRESAVNSVKNSLKSLISWNIMDLSPPQAVNQQKMSEEEEELCSGDDTERLLATGNTEILVIEEDSAEACPSYSWFTIILYGLYTLLWATLMGIAVHIEFGAVFLVTSALMFIWFNTGTHSRDSGELSAYSVFNPNCEAIDGTLKGEQLEAEIRYGALH